MTNIDIEFLEADRMPCPVCGSPTGDCTGESDYHGSINFIPHKPDDPHRTYTVPRRIYEERKDNRTGRKYRRLLYAEGARITIEEAQRLKLLPKG